MVSVTHLDSHWTQDMASEGDVFSVKVTMTMTTSTIKNRDQNEFKADPDPCRRIDSLDSISDIVSIDMSCLVIELSVLLSLKGMYRLFPRFNEGTAWTSERAEKEEKNVVKKSSRIR